MLVYFSVVDFTLNNEEKKSSNFIDFLFLKKYFFFKSLFGPSDRYIYPHV